MGIWEDLYDAEKACTRAGLFSLRGKNGLALLDVGRAIYLLERAREELEWRIDKESLR
jgi:hypothetical protein